MYKKLDIVFVNHRVQVFDLSGKRIAIIGKEGTAPGEFRYPYDVALRGDVLYVLEYGNHRIQELHFITYSKLIFMCSSKTMNFPPASALHPLPTCKTFLMIQ